MSTDTDIVTGTASYLASANIGVTYRPDGSSYLPTETGVFFGIMPETPDRVIVLNWVPGTDNISEASGDGLLQIAMRGLPNNSTDVLDLASDIRTVLHGVTGLTFNSCFLAQAYRQSSVPMGQDDSVRLVRADHYFYQIDYPASSLTP